MANNSLLNKLKQLVDADSEDELLNIYLDLAKQAVVNKAFPYGTGNESVPRKYEHNVLDIAVYLYSKQGAEGETAHNENGINRTFGSAGIPSAMLKDVVPMVGGF